MAKFIKEWENNKVKSTIRTFNDLISTTMPISMPDIQRSAEAWTPEQVEELFDSFVEFSKDAPGKHEQKKLYFLGPVVIHKQLDDDDNLVRRDLFDGQQRATNLTLMLCAIRDYFYWLHLRLDEVKNLEYASKLGWEGPKGYENLVKAQKRLSETSAIKFKDYMLNEFGWDINSDDYISFMKHLHGATTSHRVSHWQPESAESWTKDDWTDKKKKFTYVYINLGWPANDKGLEDYFTAFETTGDPEITSNQWNKEYRSEAKSHGWDDSVDGVKNYFTAKKIDPKDPSKKNFDKLVTKASNIKSANDLGWGTDVEKYLIARAELDASIYRKVHDVKRDAYEKWVKLNESKGNILILNDNEVETPDFTKIPWAGAFNGFKDNSGNMTLVGLHQAAEHIHDEAIVELDGEDTIPRISLREGHKGALRLKSLQSCEISKLKDAHLRPLNLPPGFLLKKYSLKTSGNLDKNAYGVPKSDWRWKMFRNYDAILKMIDDIFNETATKYYYKEEHSTYDIKSDSKISNFVQCKNIYGKPMIGHYYEKEDFEISCSKLWHIYYTILQYSTFSSTEITDNERMAYEIFLNMNSKGTPLSFFNIFSAKILIKIKDSTIRGEVSNLLKTIEEKIDDNSSSNTAVDKFLLSSWNSRKGDGSKKSEKIVRELIYSEINKSDDKKLKILVSSFVDDLDYYQWSANAKAIPNTIISNGSHLDMINHLQKILPKQIIPLKMSFFRNGYTKNDFYQLHRFIEGFWVFIYGLTETASSKTENFWIDCCKKVNEGEGKPYDEVLKDLIEAAEKLPAFKTFKLQNWRGAMADPQLLYDQERKITFLLRKIEHDLNPSITANKQLNDPKLLNVEHILPKNLRKTGTYIAGDGGTQWQIHFSKDKSQEHLENLWLLGNMTLLAAKPNRKISNYTFQYKCENGYRPHDNTKDKKKSSYTDEKAGMRFSDLSLNIDTDAGLYTLYSANDWTPETIGKRNRQLVCSIIEIFDIFGFFKNELIENHWGDKKDNPIEVFKETGKTITKNQFEIAEKKADSDGKDVFTIINEEF
jgi:uncharacterized protein with ParB-like and HNH nuclease domain